MLSTKDILTRAKAAEACMRRVAAKEIDRALLKMADALIENTKKILLANEIDLQLAKEKISPVMIDRLRLTEKRILDMAEGIRKISALPSPFGTVLSSSKHQNGMIINKVRVPLGVVAIIYESRPNVTSDAAALALKSSNVCVLRGGKEAYNSSKQIVDILREALRETSVPQDAINLIEDTTRESSYELMRARGFVDLLIPRGNKGLIDACVENATVPCLETGTGICHVYVDKFADFDKALSIIENAKTSRPSVCNAAEVCLVHRDIAKEFLPLLKERLTGENIKNKVELRCDKEALEIISAKPLVESDFDTEFLDYILAVGIVGSVEEAVEHILTHSTKHSEAIISENSSASEYFVKNTDSAAVYINASTRFTDGGEFGLGCEMGISTQKMHARGPLGINELTTYKYVIKGDGQVR